MKLSSGIFFDLVSKFSELKFFPVLYKSTGVVVPAKDASDDDINFSWSLKAAFWPIAIHSSEQTLAVVGAARIFGSRSSSGSCPVLLNRKVDQERFLSSLVLGGNDTILFLDLIAAATGLDSTGFLRHRS